mgnify:CR=1 FL=1
MQLAAVGVPKARSIRLSFMVTSLSGDMSVWHLKELQEKGGLEVGEQMYDWLE